jgi:hypothetical protein
VASETIKEFAVRLGFNIDDASERKFTGSLVGAVASANLLASALEKMAGVVATKVAEVSDQLEQLGYMSARVGTSAVHIRAFGQAFEQAGGSIEQGMGVLEKFQPVY